MTGHAELVAVRIPEIGAVIICMAVRPQAGAAFASCTGQDGDGMAAVDLRAAFGEKCRHLPVARIMTALEGLADQEERARPGRALPSITDG